MSLSHYFLRQFATATDLSRRKGAPLSLVVKTWLNPDGTVERVAFAAQSDERANSDLRTILTRGNIGEPPPTEMIQPINLRFSLRLVKE